MRLCLDAVWPVAWDVVVITVAVATTWAPLDLQESHVPDLTRAWHDVAGPLRWATGRHGLGAIVWHALCPTSCLCGASAKIATDFWICAFLFLQIPEFLCLQIPEFLTISDNFFKFLTISADSWISISDSWFSRRKPLLRNRNDNLRNRNNN